MLDAGRRRHARARRPTSFAGDPASAAIFLNQRPALRCRRPAGAEGPRGDAAADRRGTAPTASTRARSARRSSPRAAAGKGIITQADLDQYTTRELRADRVRLPRLPRRLGAAAELGRRRSSARSSTSSKAIRCKELGFRSAQAVHYQIEAMRHAYVDRNSYLGDPDFVKNPLDAPARQGLRRQDPRRDRPDEGRRLEATSSPASPPHEGSNTTHYSIVDKRGQRGRGDLHAQRLVRRQGHRRPAPACCSTTRWTTSPPSSACPTCTAWCRARPTRSRRASGR